MLILIFIKKKDTLLTVLSIDKIDSVPLSMAADWLPHHSTSKIQSS
jgi:hypothetical protein